MRAVWKGAISFGLVSIPVKLYRATETKDVGFHQVRASDGSRVRYQRIAVADGEEVAYADLAKGYELPSGETVVLTDDDLADLPLTTNRAIDVDTFVPLEQVDPIYFDKTYYVEPDGKQALKPYALLRDALAGSGRVAVVKIALRQREQVATLRARDGVFVLETMVWPDEVREADFAFLDEKVDVRDQELAMAASLIDSLAGDFDPNAYTDAYREALEQVIAAKIEGRELIAAPAAGGDKGGDVVDLMSALRASVDAAKKSRAARESGSIDGSTEQAAEPAAKKAEPKPKKAAAKKAGGPAKTSAKAPSRGSRARKSA
jgi:DNA end-binding protein Ku